MESSKKQNVFAIEVFCKKKKKRNYIYIYAVVFDQFSASLLNENINFFKKIK